ncbi:MAG: hypothetical protein COA79_04540 [Planctomycetota bacterium]|nr:MAG: hypothetical protein COA79_04540 [Planctomycetota bacterium]
MVKFVYVLSIFICLVYAPLIGQDDKPLPKELISFKANTFDVDWRSGDLNELIDEINLQWRFDRKIDYSKKGVLVIRRKGSAPDESKVIDGREYMGPAITSEYFYEELLYAQGDLSLSTKTILTSDITGGVILLSEDLLSSKNILSPVVLKEIPGVALGGKCFLLIGANGKDKAEIVSYTRVQDSGFVEIVRGELGTSAIDHATGSSVFFYPPRPVELNIMLSDSNEGKGNIVVAHSAGGLVGFPEKGVVRIDNELIGYSNIDFGNSSNSLIISKRGVDNTEVKLHSKGSNIYWAYHPTYKAEIQVSSTEGFPDSGRLKIDDEEFWYYNKTDTSFRGIVRGIFADDFKADDTVVSSHATGAKVIDSLYKVIMNDKDTDGFDDNNDGNDDDIQNYWYDRLYFGDKPSEYYYHIMIYNDELSYSASYSDRVSEMQVRIFTPYQNDKLILDPDDMVYELFDDNKIIEAQGGDKFYLKIEGGEGPFIWDSTELIGLEIGVAPDGYDIGGEPTRFALYQAPDLYSLAGEEIVVSVSDIKNESAGIAFNIIDFCEYCYTSFLEVLVEVNGKELVYDSDFEIEILNHESIDFTIFSSNGTSSLTYTGTYNFTGLFILDP